MEEGSYDAKHGDKGLNCSEPSSRFSVRLEYTLQSLIECKTKETWKHSWSPTQHRHMCSFSLCLQRWSCHINLESQNQIPFWCSSKGRIRNWKHKRTWECWSNHAGKMKVSSETSMHIREIMNSYCRNFLQNMFSSSLLIGYMLVYFLWLSLAQSMRFFLIDLCPHYPLLLLCLCNTT